MQRTIRGENKIKVHFGMPDYLKWYNEKYNDTCSKELFNKVVGEFNEGLIDLMLNKNIDYTPPKLQMTYTIRKTERIPRVENGKLVNKLPVDYKATNELWATNPEAKEKKILVRHINKHTGRHIFSIKLVKTGGAYSNKKYYTFKPARDFQRALAKRIFDESKDTFDTYNLY